MTVDVDDKRIEEHVRKLVEVLSELPGIVTLSPRAGDLISRRRRRDPAADFYLDFNVNVLAGGWHSLNILVFATSQTDSLENLSVRAWPNTDEPTDCVAFTLQGLKNANPDELANAIEQVLEGDYSGHDEPTRQLGR
jgi:hypothetical protein